MFAPSSEKGKPSDLVERDDEQAPPWRPSLNAGVELRGLPLTPEEGFIASRLDGATDLRTLSQVTGLPADPIGTALEKLVSLGAVSAAAVADGSAPAAEPDDEAEAATSRPVRIASCSRPRCAS